MECFNYDCKFYKECIGINEKEYCPDFKNKSNNGKNNMRKINILEINHVKTVHQEYPENYITQYKVKDEYIEDPVLLFDFSRSDIGKELERIEYNIITFVRDHNGKEIKTHYAVPINEVMGSVPFLQEILNYKIDNFRQREYFCNRIENRCSFLENENDYLRSIIEKLTSSKVINFLSRFFIKKQQEK